MTKNYLCIGVMSAVLLQYSVVVQATEIKDTRIEVLERQLGERDKVMLELLDRIEALEQRFGVKRVIKDASSPRQAPAKEEISGTPGAVVVDARTAERALERSLSREGALLLPAGTLELEQGLSFSRLEQFTNSFVVAGGDTLAAQTERNANRLSVDMGARLGLPWDTQLEIGVPFRVAEIETTTNVGFAPAASSSTRGSGFGDLRVGLAKTLVRENLWRPDVVGRITWDTDTGQSSDNGVSLGGGFNEVRGSLTAIKRQDPVVFIGGLSYLHSFEKEHFLPGPVYAMNLGAAYALSPETSLRLGVSGGWQGEVEHFGSKVEGSSRTFGTFLIGGSTLLAPGVLLNASLGIGLTDDADDFSLTFSLPIRFQTPVF